MSWTEVFSLNPGTWVTYGSTAPADLLATCSNNYIGPLPGTCTTAGERRSFLSDPLPDDSPPSPFVPIKLDCLPSPLGSGSKIFYDTISPRGEDVWNNRSVSVHACHDKYSYTIWTFAGTPKNRAKELLSAITEALFGNPSPLYILSVTTINRPLLPDEQLLGVELEKSIDLPPLWIIRKNGTISTRPVYRRNADGTVGSKVGIVDIFTDGKPRSCRCQLPEYRAQTSTSQYCSVSGYKDSVTQKDFSIDSITICVNP